VVIVSPFLRGHLIFSSLRASFARQSGFNCFERPLTLGEATEKAELPIVVGRDWCAFHQPDNKKQGVTSFGGLTKTGSISPYTGFASFFCAAIWF
jgi:hypothetical protein